MKKSTNRSLKPLHLNRETVRALVAQDLRLANGGLMSEKITITCAPGSDCCSYACSNGCC
jgi:hypothetical protein